MIKAKIPYGKKQVKVNIPKKNLLKLCEPKFFSPVKDENLELKRSLNNPIDSDRLCKIAKGKKKTAVILVTDITRITPEQLLLPRVIKELNKGGINNRDISIIIARGQHRKMTDEEIKFKLGGKIIGEFKVYQHDPDRNLEFVGKSSFGHKIWINKKVMSADIKIGVGNTIPHRYAGFGGGAKIILPGVSGRETIRNNHLMVTKSNKAIIGILESNPIRQEMEEAARMANIDFIVNTVLNQENKIIKIFSGDVYEAHKESVKLAKEVYGIKIPEKADIVIGDAYPMDIQFYQASKVIENTESVVNNNGTLIIISPCYEGIGSKDFLFFMKEDSPQSIVESIINNPNKNIVAGVVSYLIQKFMEKAKIEIVTEGLSEEEIETLKLIKRSTPQEAINEALKKYGSEAKILIFPMASITYGLI